MRRIKYAVATLAAAMMTAGLTSCGDDSESTASEGNDKVTIGIQPFPVVANPVWAAQVKDYFADQDLDVEVKVFDNGTQQNQALVGGSVDAVLGGAGAINIAVRGDGVLVMPTFIAMTSIPLVGGTSSVQSAADLDGKKVAVPLGSDAEVLIYLASQEAGVDYDSIDKVNMTFADTANALQSNSVDAAVLSVSQAAAVQRAMPDSSVVAQFEDFLPDYADIGGLIFSNRFLDERPDVATRFLAAIAQGYEAAHTDDALSQQIYEDEYAETLSQDDYETLLETSDYPSLDEIQSDIDSGQLADWISNTSEVFVTLGVLEDTGNPDEFIGADQFKSAVDLIG